jgi:hypothetical protein
LADDRKHVFPYGFDLLELKGSNLDESLLQQNASATPMANAGHREHSDTATISRGRRIRKI